ncbi:MAG TPA: hypothetical protein VN722_11915 [Hanamia sp.]|nr:hypothetical protein [Hanamia sp.]
MYEWIKNNTAHSFKENSPDTQPIISPKENEFVVPKKRISAFAGSDLEMLLRA